jgi:hypothetical protein
MNTSVDVYVSYIGTNSVTLEGSKCTNYRNSNSEFRSGRVDRTPCAACGTNGGIRSMVEQLGLKDLTVIGPDGSMVITPR